MYRMSKLMYAVLLKELKTRQAVITYINQTSRLKYPIHDIQTVNQ